MVELRLSHVAEESVPWRPGSQRAADNVFATG